MCQYISNQNTPTQEFSHGYNDLTQTQQLIAFWTHTIDTFACVLEHDTNIYLNEVSQNTLESCGTNTTYTYMGAVRAGFHKSIQNLPDEIRLPVETYYEDRIKEMKTIVSEDVHEIDFIFGTGDPFRYEE